MYPDQRDQLQCNMYMPGPSGAAQRRSDHRMRQLWLSGMFVCGLKKLPIILVMGVALGVMNAGEANARTYASNLRNGGVQRAATAERVGTQENKVCFIGFSGIRIHPLSCHPLQVLL